MGSYIQPFDFKTILVEYFLGKQELFVFALVFLLSFAAAKYQMSNVTYLTLLAISSILFAAYLGEAIYFLILVLLGLIVFKSISKLVT